MGLVWNVWGVSFALLGLCAAGAAWLVYATRPDRTQNRLLALALAFEGSLLLWAGLPMMMDAPRDVYAARVVNQVVAWPYMFAYLLFLGTLETPLARPLRVLWVRGAVGVLAVAASASVLLWPGLYLLGVERGAYSLYEAVFGPANLLLGMVLLGIFLAGLAIAFSTWRRAAPGSHARSRARMFLAAFGTRDVLLFASFAPVWLGETRSAEAQVAAHLNEIQVVAWALFLALLVYGILKHQLFDIDLKLKWTVRRGTVAAILLGVFFVVSELAQLVLSEVVGTVVGIVAAGLLVVAIAPLQRAADRLADRALPSVRDTAEYRTVRRREVYRAAVEGALQDGIVTDKERDILARLQDHLGLTATEARALEREAVRGAAP